ncbi:MAG: zinc-binding dehydrogenase [Myxococcota bacterium]|jgi:NADPH:quinone reductase-like Zn-dependent oxidoreductase|nr:zinc-binding dehydrogenase [Myxococcota bacterium]
MKALRFVDGALRLEELPEAALHAGSVRVRVRASGLNRADLLQRRGRYPAPPPYAPDRPGLEFAGTVLECGPGATRFERGAPVLGLVGGEAQSEQVVVDERLLLPIPAALDFAQAAAIPEAFATAYDAIVLQARLAPGEDVLLHAAGSGVGSAALQVVRHAGGRAFGSSRSAEKLRRLTQLGLYHGVCTREGWSSALLDALRAASKADGFPVIIDLVGASTMPANLQLACPGARIVLLGLMSGPKTQLDLSQLLMKRLHIWGSTLRSRSVEQKAALLASMQAALWPAFEEGSLEPVLAESWPVEEAERAYARLEDGGDGQTGGLLGKVVLSWD